MLSTREYSLPGPLSPSLFTVTTMVCMSTNELSSKKRWSKLPSTLNFFFKIDPWYIKTGFSIVPNFALPFTTDVVMDSGIENI